MDNGKWKMDNGKWIMDNGSEMIRCDCQTIVFSCITRL